MEPLCEMLSACSTLISQGAVGQDLLPIAQNGNNVTITNAQQTLTPDTPEAAIIVNSVGAFSNASIFGRPLIADSLHNIPGGTPQAQVFLPLHELAHLTGATQMPDPTGKLHQATDTAIEKKCKQTLHGATR